jgi:hypothetical protein
MQCDAQSTYAVYFERPIMTALEQLSFKFLSLEKLSCEFITAAKGLMTK